METVATQVRLPELNSFISKVGKYPVSAHQLLKLADRINAPKVVTDFYKRFAPDRVFESREDLSGSSEIVELLREEEAEMPKEELRSPEDD